MKKAAIITAIVLTAVGLALCAGAILLGVNLNTMELMNKTYPVQEAFSDIRIQTHETNIRFAPSEDGACFVDATTAKKIVLNVAVQDGTLVIENTDARRWMERLFSFGTQTVTVYLPGDTYRNLTIESNTGDVALPDTFRFERMQIKGSTGRIQCDASASGPMEIKTSTGDIELNRVSADSLTIAVTTATVKLNGVTLNGDAAIDVSTGKTEINELACRNFRSEGSTGRITLNNAVASETLFIKRSTGDVHFEASDAKDIRVETSTGDVTGTLRSAKIFDVHVSTGKVHVPNTNEGGKCEISVGSGDIVIELTNDAGF